MMNILDVIVNAAVGGVFALASGPFGTADLPEKTMTSVMSLPSGRPPVRVESPDGVLVDMIPATGASGLPLASYPKVLTDALITSEDGRFGEHGGIDGEGLAKAVISNLRGVPRGGSGIAQQLAKNAVTGSDRTLSRKISEGALAIRITALYPENEIIQAYLANVWFGRGVTGAADAPRAWFGKGWADITDAEAITLVVMLRGPARYDPYARPERVKRMRDALAKRMFAQGLLDQERLDAVIAAEVSATPPAASGSETWVGMAAARDAAGVSHDGKVVTTISPEWQDIATSSLASGLKGVRSSGTPGGMNGAVVVMSVRDGKVLASVGGVGEAGFDRTFAMRQPGSAAKPFFYLSALDQGMSPYDLVRNDTFRIGNWRPRNANGKETGPVALYAGLEQSSNLMTLHLTDSVSMDTMFSVAEASGAWQPDGIYRAPVSMLGASETSLRALASGFAGIMAGGETRSGSSLEGHDPGGYVFASPQASDEVIRMMRGVVTRGTAASAMRGLEVPIVGKTGTTQDGRDGVFVGATASVVVAVWAGRDDNKVPNPPMRGNGVPATVARGVFEKALAAGLIDRNGVTEDGEVAVTWPTEPFSKNGGGYVSQPQQPVHSASGGDPFTSGDPLAEALARALSGGDGSVVTDGDGFAVRDLNGDMWE